MLVAVLCFVAFGLAQVSNNPAISTGRMTMAGVEAATPVSCAAPAMYVIGENADSAAAFYYTFDAPTVAQRTWYSAIGSRLSTCRFRFGGTNDDNANGAATATAVNCGTLTGNCRRCSILGPCLCNRMTAGQTQQDITVFYKFTWQDNNNPPLFDESTEQTATIKVSQQGKPGCPIDWSLPASPLQQMSQIPPFVQ